MKEDNSFFKASLILIIANVISKILGALFKIPLTYILKEEGMAIYSTASSVYSMFLTLVISGIPLATSRLISQDMALKKPADALKTVRFSKWLLMAIGGLSSLILFFLAKPLAFAMKDPSAEISIKIISPAIFFVAWGNAYKSYFQGSKTLIPTAIIQVIESLVRLVIGFVLAVLFINHQVSIKTGAAIFGVTTGEILATLLLGLIYLFYKRTTPKTITPDKSYKTIYSSIMAVALPLFISQTALSALNILDTALVRNQLLNIRFSPESARAFLLDFSSYTTLFDNLQATLKLSGEGARWLYGAYSGYALTVFHLPLGMIATLSVSILPLIAGGIARGDMASVRRNSKTAINLCLTFSVPAAVLFMTSSESILHLLFHNTASAKMLTFISPCLIFLSLSQIFTSIFHSAGRVFEPFFINLLGIGIKLLGNFILIKIPYLNIYGAIISSNLAFFIIMISEGLLLKKTLGIKFQKKEIFSIILSSIPMFIVIKLTLLPLEYIFKFRFIALVFSAFSGFLAYILTLSMLSPDGSLSFLKRKS